MIIDATDLILGRLAAFAAKQALLGEKVDIINTERVVISGTKSQILEKYKTKMSRGIPAKGPFIPRLPDRFVKRVIRGMLPYKQEKGRKAFKRIKCYIGFPDELKNEKPVLVEGAHLSKLPHYNYLSVKEICKILGGIV